MLGAIIGDIAGSIYEFDNYRAKDFEFFGRHADFTDDTVCTIAVADALLHGKPPADALYEWCNRYPGRGYGGMFGQWIQSCYGYDLSRTVDGIRPHYRFNEKVGKALA